MPVAAEAATDASKGDNGAMLVNLAMPGEAVPIRSRDRFLADDADEQADQKLRQSWRTPIYLEIHGRHAGAMPTTPNAKK